jgi:hypothetical protein
MEIVVTTTLALGSRELAKARTPVWFMLHGFFATQSCECCAVYQAAQYAPSCMLRMPLLRPWLTCNAREVPSRTRARFANAARGVPPCVHIGSMPQSARFRSLESADAARRGVQDGAIVTRLAAIEDLSGMNILCSDKTGARLLVANLQHSSHRIAENVRAEPSALSLSVTGPVSATL